MRERAKLLQMVFQDPFASLNPELLLRTQPRRSASASAFSDRHCVAISGIVDERRRVASRVPGALSASTPGGQRQRFAARARSAANPKILLADEPVSSLDIAVQAQIAQPT